MALQEEVRSAVSGSTNARHMRTARSTACAAALRTNQDCFAGRQAACRMTCLDLFAGCFYSRLQAVLLHCMGYQQDVYHILQRVVGVDCDMAVYSEPEKEDCEGQTSTWAPQAGLCGWLLYSALRRLSEPRRAGFCGPQI